MKVTCLSYINVIEEVSEEVKSMRIIIRNIDLTLVVSYLKRMLILNFFSSTSQENANANSLLML